MNIMWQLTILLDRSDRMSKDDRTDIVLQLQRRLERASRLAKKITRNMPNRG
jgi:hypothetical protein